MNKTESLTILKLSGKMIEPHLASLASLRIQVFREFPYLYDGSLDYEKKYLSVYVHSPESIAIFVYDGEDLIGASTGLPLADEAPEFKKPFVDNNMDPEDIFYCGESILLPAYRGRSIYSIFMNGREKHARVLGKFDTICFCAVQRPENHPLRPGNYRPLDPVWEKFGYRKDSVFKTHFIWKDVNEKKESPKELVFWMKKL
jgi:hypothetical protein